MESSTLESVFDLDKIRLNWNRRKESASKSEIVEKEKNDSLFHLKLFEESLGELAKKQPLVFLLGKVRGALMQPDPKNAEALLTLLDQIEDFLDVEMFWNE